MNTFIPDQNLTLNTYHLLKPLEVASLLRISRSFAYQLLQTGEIPVVRIGTACRVRQQDLDAYIQKNIYIQLENQ